MSQWIYMPDFGDNGRLGNQLFQYAALDFFARRHGLKLIGPTRKRSPLFVEKFCSKNADALFPLNGHGDARVLNFNNGHGDIRTVIKAVDTAVKEEGLNVTLRGYFQDYRFIRPELLQDFFPIYKGSEGNELPRIGVHIRLGDYNIVRPQHFAECPPSYYANAINSIIDQMGNDNFYYQVVLASDGTAHEVETFWQQVMSRLDDRTKPVCITRLSEGSEFDDFQELASCEHQIICNSTFSWWAAYMNQNPSKIVVKPSRWFGPANAVVHSDEGFKVPGWLEVDNG